MEYRTPWRVGAARVAGRPGLQQFRPPYRLRGVAAGGAQSARTSASRSTPCRCIAARSAVPRNSSAARWGRDARTSCWQPRSACRWTSAAPRGRSSWLASKRACDGSTPIDRSLSAAPARPADADRGETLRVRRSDPSGQGVPCPTRKPGRWQRLAGHRARLGWRHSCHVRTNAPASLARRADRELIPMMQTRHAAVLSAGERRHRQLPSQHIDAGRRTTDRPWCAMATGSSMMDVADPFERLEVSPKRAQDAAFAELAFGWLAARSCVSSITPPARRSRNNWTTMFVRGRVLSWTICRRSTRSLATG